MRVAFIENAVAFIKRVGGIFRQDVKLVEQIAYANVVRFVKPSELGEIETSFHFFRVVDALPKTITFGKPSAEPGMIVRLNP